MRPVEDLGQTMSPGLGFSGGDIRRLTHSVVAEGLPALTCCRSFGSLWPEVVLAYHFDLPPACLDCISTLMTVKAILLKEAA